MAVHYFTTPNDPNNVNEHAIVSGVHFVALPHQSFRARRGNRSASVARSTGPRIMANTRICFTDGTGRCAPVEHQRFATTDRDRAFTWASEYLKDEPDDEEDD